MKVVRYCVLILITLSMMPSLLLSADLKVSLAQMPVYAESKDKGVLVELSKQIAEELKMELKLVVVPFSRSISNVISKEYDLHMPLIESPGYRNEVLDFDYSTATIFHVNFVLYENKDRPLNMEQLGMSKIETDRAHVNYFPFETIPSSCFECSLKKVNIGRIDGFIFADFASDPIIKNQNLNRIKRRLYRVFDVKIVLAKGERGGSVDNLITKAINSLQEKGVYQQIMGQVDVPYNDWQP